jgi:hypothetical protein
LRTDFRSAARDGDLPLASVAFNSSTSHWARIAGGKSVLMFDALRKEMGDTRFFPFMKSWFAANAGKKVTAAAFERAAEEAAAKPLGDFFARWLTQTGLPGDSGGPSYLAGEIVSRPASTLIVYGTVLEAGANRYAAELFQRTSLDRFESAAPIRKDFELTSEDLRTHDIVFIGRPESNSALASIAGAIGLDWAGALFRVNGTGHASEYESLAYAATNPVASRHMILVLAGNSPLQTVKIASKLTGRQYAVYRNGEEIESGMTGK